MPLTPSDSLQPSHGLMAEKLAEIAALAAVCNAQEGLDLKLNEEILRRRPSDEVNDWLFYAAEILVGFLGLYHLDKPEIALMVHPDHRRQGIGRTLLSAALDSCRRRDIRDPLLVCEQKSASGQAFVVTTGGRFEHAEYEMERTGTAPLPPHGMDLEWRDATGADLAVLSHMLSIGFDSSEKLAASLVGPQLGDPGHRTFLASLDGKPVGTIGAGLGQGSAFLAGLVVLPEYRGRGFGRQIFSRAVEAMLAEGRMRLELEVAADNPQMLGVYQSCGFRETRAYDYFALDLGA